MSFLVNWKGRLAVALLMAVATGAVVYAQLEGGDRGVAPIASTGDFEVYGIEVDVKADSPAEARKKGWEEAQRLGWQKLYAKTQGGKASALPDGTLNNIVSAIIVEKEQIGPKRYIATLGIMFDRARAGQILGVGGQRLRSPPLLVLPVMWNAGAPVVFEQQSEWQKAWARFRSGDSAIDYVRPYGSGAESLVLTAGQANRRERLWWRTVLDQFGAADVIIPIARIDYAYPGGPVTGKFTARYGPDNRYIGGFTLKVSSSEKIPDMMDEAISRLDKLYVNALSQGTLKTDKSLTFDDSLDIAALEAQIEKELAAEGLKPKPPVISDNSNAAPASGGSATSSTPPGPAVTLSVQFDTPDVGAVGRGESAVRSVPGVSSASTSSLAVGGVSVMRVNFTGDPATLAAALRSRGWQVQQSGGSLRISRPAPSRPANPQPSSGGSTEPQQ